MACRGVWGCEGSPQLSVLPSLWERPKVALGSGARAITARGKWGAQPARESAAASPIPSLGGEGIEAEETPHQRFSPLSPPFPLLLLARLGKKAPSASQLRRARTALAGMGSPLLLQTLPPPHAYLDAYPRILAPHFASPHSPALRSHSQQLEHHRSYAGSEWHPRGGAAAPCKSECCAPL